MTKSPCKILHDKDMDINMESKKEELNKDRMREIKAKQGRELNMISGNAIILKK